MDIMALGAIGELVGGVAVIATLIYLALQVRHSARAARSASYQAAVTSVSEWTLVVGSDPETTALFHRGLDGLNALTVEEQLQWGMLLTSAVRNFENIHYQYEIGSLDEDVWTPWAARMQGIFRTVGARAWWAQQRSAFSRGFQTFVEDASGPAVPVVTPYDDSGA